jgi:hypothetical protein
LRVNSGYARRKVDDRARDARGRTFADIWCQLIARESSQNPERSEKRRNHSVSAERMNFFFYTSRAHVRVTHDAALT